MSDALDETAATPRSRTRRIAVTVLLIAGTLMMVGAGIGIWAQRQALDTDNWVDTSSDLLENEPIRTAVGLYLVETLYDSDQVKERLETTLPPALQPLAGPAAAGLKELARRNAPRLLGSAVALTAWQDANRGAHETLLRAIDGADVPVDLTSAGCWSRSPPRRVCRPLPWTGCHPTSPSCRSRRPRRSRRCAPPSTRSAPSDGSSSGSR